MNKTAITGFILVLIAAVVAIKVGTRNTADRVESNSYVQVGDAPADTLVVHENGCPNCSHTNDSSAEESNHAPPVIALDHIPAGKLKTELLALNAENLQDALNTLSSMNFHTNDVDSVRVDSGGAIYFICTFTNTEDAERSEGIVAAENEEGSEILLLEEGAGVPISQPPIRHSRPGSSKVLFLDFNGHVVSGTRWNSNTNYGPTASWDCKAWSMDGDRTTFSSAEQSNIIQIWERVAEDYAPFDVDVTTEQPTAWTSSTGHALITPTTDKNGVHCPHYGYGGIAYVGVFGNSTYSYNSSSARSPAWCIDYTGANCAEVISHELGHNMGLSHDRTASQSYYPGHVNGGIKWGPIMGTGYGDDVSQWCKGEFFNSTQGQDDLVIIQNRVGYRPDDHGDNNGSASELTVVGSGDIEDGGVIETTGDPDVFSFFTGAGNISINADAYKAGSSTWGANLDILLELYNSSGALIASTNPELDIDASISTTLAAGQYYIHVKPTGVGTPLASTPSGYTSYGSLGQYWLTGSVSADADSDLMPNAWEFQYFGHPTAALPDNDADHDGANNLTEYITGYDPTDSGSVFRMSSYALPSQTGEPAIITWPTKPGRLYSVSYSPNLQYIDFTTFPDAIDLLPVRNSYTDHVEHAESAIFYHVEVKLAP